MNTIPQELVPEAVVASLTQAELEELKLIIAKNDAKPVFSAGMIDSFETVNRGLWYLSMSYPIKYTFIKLPQVDEASVLELVTFDSTRIDQASRLLRSDFEPLQALWEQRFSLTMAALGNPNLSEASAETLIEELIESEPTDLSVPEILVAVGYQLFDKWNPENFPKSSLCELVRIFELNGVTEYLPKLKRLSRKAR